MADGKLPAGKRIRTAMTGKTVTVQKYIAGGGQGDVYLVDWDGERKALKWYRDGKSMPPDLYKLLQDNITKGSPGENFMWPLDITDREGDEYGYIMDLIPKGYYSLEDYLLCTQRFETFRVAADACLEIAAVFKALHSHGYCYQDLNAGNFFFRPETGDVVICDNDNVAPNGKTTGIIGTPGFMAPEIVVGYWEAQQKKGPYVLPDWRTDRFSMAVLFFEMLTLSNPLEGKHSLVPLNAEMKAHLYGYDALFMMDPQDRGNAPDPVIHKNVVNVWAVLPGYMRDTFQKAFSKKAIKNPNRRLDESAWIAALVRFRSDIIRCPCGADADLFLSDDGSSHCDRCGRNVRPPMRFVFEDGTRIPAIPGTRVYRCQVGVAPIGHELEPVANVLANPSKPSLFGARNLTAKKWIASVPGGEPRTFGPNDVLPLVPGGTFKVFGKTVKIEINNE